MLGHKCYWAICMKHTNELKLRHLLIFLDGPTSSKDGFTGYVYKNLKWRGYAFLIKFPKLDEKGIKNLSTDAYISYRYVNATKSGKLSLDLANLKCGSLSHSRSLTLEVFSCPSNLFEYGDYCYLFASGSATQNGLSWQMSLVVCKTMQGNLLNVADQAENLFILNHLRNISINDLHFWIGLNNLQRTYVWSDHKTSLFYSWSQGQPDNYSSLEVCVDVTSNGWSDATCDNTYGYICKTKQACGGTCNG
nr:lithostathine-1-like [Hydra vulgaris]